MQHVQAGCGANEYTAVFFMSLINALVILSYSRQPFSLADRSKSAGYLDDRDFSDIDDPLTPKQAVDPI